MIDATTGNHLWAEKYDRVLEDIFAVQEKVTQAIVAALAPQIDLSEWTHAVKPGNLPAYERALQAWACIMPGAWDEAAQASRDRAVQLAREALAIDPRCGVAWRTIAQVQFLNLQLGAGDAHGAALANGVDACQRLLAIDPNDHAAYMWKGFLALFSTDPWASLADLRRAHELNPNDAFALTLLAFSEAACGHAEASLDHASRALRLSPRDPSRYVLLKVQAWACALAGDYAKGAQWAEQSIAAFAMWPAPHVCLAICRFGMGDIERARTSFEVLRQLAPVFAAARLAGSSMMVSPVLRHRTHMFLRVAAGLEDPTMANTLR